MYENPSIEQFKEYFFRDFPYGTDIETSVTDQDIVKAFIQTNSNIPQALFSGQSFYTNGYLNLSAHYLTLNLLTSSQGINGQYSFLEQSKSVGSVSQSFAIPQRILDNPSLAFLLKTNYGALYLEMILPQLAGQMFIAYGSTRP